MRKLKIIVVAYPLGRIGSSALMGLLRISGLNVGRGDRLSDAAPMNPKGFFELKSQQQFLKEVYPGIYPDISNPPTLTIIDEIGNKNFLDYENLIKSEFSDTFPIAVKSQRFLTLPFLHRLKSKYNIKVLVMIRNTTDMVNSIKRVWELSDDPAKKLASKGFIEEWLNRWILFGNDIQGFYKFDYYHVNFDDLMAEQIATTKAVTDFLEIDCPSPLEVQRWLDKSLVNREFIK